MEIKKVNIQQKLDTIQEFWSLREVAQINDHVVEIAKLKGEYEMHAHDTGEKIFYILSGELQIQFDEETSVAVGQGEFVVIPNNTVHKPIAKEETHILLFEPKYK